MKPEFPELACPLTFVTWDAERASLDVQPPGSPVAYPVALFNSDPEDRPAMDAAAHRLADVWNACLGLDLPDDLPPGFLAGLVALSRNLAVSLRDYPQSNITHEYGRMLLEQLEKLNPPPVSREDLARSKGWTREYIEGNGVDAEMWVSPDKKRSYYELPEEL